MRFFWKEHLFKTFGKRKYGFPCSAINDPNTIETKIIFETIVLFNLSLFLSASPLVLHYQNLALIGFSLLFPDFELPNFINQPLLLQTPLQLGTGE